MPMSERELTVCFVDDFHDWIDGDDPVVSYEQVADNSIDVTFESGARFNVKVTELPPQARPSKGRPMAELLKVAERIVEMTEQLSDPQKLSPTWVRDGLLFALVRTEGASPRMKELAAKYGIDTEDAPQ